MASITRAYEVLSQDLVKCQKLREGSQNCPIALQFVSRFGSSTADPRLIFQTYKRFSSHNLVASRRRIVLISIDPVSTWLYDIRIYGENLCHYIERIILCLGILLFINTCFYNCSYCHMTILQCDSSFIENNSFTISIVFRLSTTSEVICNIFNTNSTLYAVFRLTLKTPNLVLLCTMYNRSPILGARSSDLFIPAKTK